MKKIIILFLVINSVFVFGQVNKTTYNDFGFVKDISISAKDSLNVLYKYAWAGGLNSCQLSKIDLNLDSIMDLVIFDRMGNRLVTFINNGTPNVADYTYTTQYAVKFPYLHDWVQLLDYNCDGKVDIYTYSGTGIALYKNVSDTALKFVQVSNQLLSFQYLNYIGIYSSTVDFPAIVDIDNDGDLDILSFWVLGTYVQLHKNLSIETYGVCDSLKFDLAEECWGKFAENSNSNQILLNDTSVYCNSKNNPADTLGMKKDEFRHSGSTLTAFDIDGDNDKDLLVGDVDFPQIKALTNGGTVSNALITSQDTLFPSYNTPISVIAFPVCSYLDIDNDNKRDLVVSPFDEKNDLYAVSDNFESMLFYKNIGTATVPVFSFQKNNLFQEDMIEVGGGAYPVLFDYDNDGLKDIFVSNVGYWDSSYYYNASLYSKFVSKIALFKNVGTASNPSFQLITRDFAGISFLKLNSIYPTFGDIDGDSDIDMMIGESKGNLYFYENTAGAGNPVSMLLNQINYQAINVGKSSTPQLIDLNRDGLLDMVIGERNGNLNYYRNDGTTTNPIFNFITDSLGKVSVINHLTSNFGYSVPCFFEDTIGHYKLFVGSEYGNIHYYKNIEGNLTGAFTEEDSKLLFIYEGIRSAVAVGNLDNDAFLDMIVGNYSGGLGYYKGSQPTISGIEENTITNVEISVFPNPAMNEITIQLDNTLQYKKIGFDVFDLIGKKILSKEIKNANNTKIDVSKMANGIYFLRTAITLKNGREFQNVSRFVVNK